MFKKIVSFFAPASLAASGAALGKPLASATVTERLSALIVEANEAAGVHAQQALAQRELAGTILAGAETSESERDKIVALAAAASSILNPVVEDPQQPELAIDTAAAAEDDKGDK